MNCGQTGLRIHWAAVRLDYSKAGLRLCWAAVRLSCDYAGCG